MKKYINRFFMLATLLVAGMAFVSCEKENGPVEGTFTMSVNAVKGGSNASKALTGDGDAINATWTADDVVKVYKSGVEVGSLTAASSGASTKLNGSITGSIAQGDNLTLEFLSPDYQNGQDGTLDYIAAHCDFAVANVTVASISGNEIRITGNSATFENQQAIVKFTLQDKANDADLSASAFYVALPAISDKKVSLFAKTAAGWYSYGQTGISFANGQYYTISAKLGQTGKLPGVFSIDGSNTVHFSQGNLKYASGTWSFHTHQYDMVGGISQTTSNMDLFYWGGSSKGYGATDDYTSGGELTTDVVNWGANITSGTWNTPSKTEWLYIFNNRSTSTVNGTANARFARGQVCGVNGVILFPNRYTHPTDVALPVDINDDFNYIEWGTHNVYSSANWAKMEAAGAVFLPAAGYRYGTDVYVVGDYGYYWSSTTYDDNNTWGVDFHVSNVYTDGSLGRNCGQSVRLVCE